MTIDQLINDLISNGGAIVSSNDCSEMEIADAQATGRFYVRDDGIGIVRRTKKWLELHTEGDREACEKFYRDFSCKNRFVCNALPTLCPGILNCPDSERIG